jgi:hypothetical protein
MFPAQVHDAVRSASVTLVIGTRRGSDAKIEQEERLGSRRGQG